jgi:histone arginine demethylase JMJD6
VGRKRWVLFPPHVPKHIAKGKNFCCKGEDDEAIHFFMTILPRIKQKAQEVGNTGEFKDFACYEFTQEAGETVFIPNGWWHGVLNITHTVGITQNFCSPRNFPQVWRKTRSGRKLMAVKWLNQLDVHYPHLAKVARDMNDRDGFVHKYNPETIRQRDVAKKRFRETEARRKGEQELQAKGDVADAALKNQGGDELLDQSRGGSKHSRRESPRNIMDVEMGQQVT